MRIVEMYYTPAQVSLLLGLHRKTVLGLLRAGEFGTATVNLGSEIRPHYRVPASAVNAYLDARRIFTKSPSNVADLGIRACSEHELRRKVASVAQAA